MQTGLAVWRQRMREAIARGDIARFPGGRKSNAEKARKLAIARSSHYDQAAVRLAANGGRMPRPYSPGVTYHATRSSRPKGWPCRQ
jgi:hypothetical protein